MLVDQQPCGAVREKDFDRFKREICGATASEGLRSPPCLEPSEAYLCCIALLNLTFSAESVETHRLLRSAPFRCARDSGVPDACGREERMTMTRLSV